MDEYAANIGVSNGSYFHFDIFDLLDYEDAEDNEDIKRGWQELQSELKKANIFSFYVHYW